ncbi:MAG: orotate phosphoribosyltransferase [Candidatus Marinimicrobia bacterium]|jgi:orotate phosphoribosyltransferase|nr:orotate phosphoribosyltransferase [Candidatus Neomarinimicrobiota bacterium]MBT3944844.1 orotate phosphoribosyltransferase [Candidatus Neomarinimicrobiota bacterium]MBT4555813.1 orotate phosphoribosyltransferase [Candidatus Neomarinimicrobiota bacterium]MBT4752972.1 orotate phosphoribosyltransferase [Candidatus Neomarinimicrobiota bacterium]MBT5115476.1 orotate phosphoribosyltransferase [Candidatus Neomarinimicrobiota bacterium]
MINKQHIFDIFKSTEALLSGHFVLTSRRHSSTYFQCAKVLQHPKYLTEFSRMIADEFENTEPDVVISPAIGGVVLGTEVGTQMGCRTIFAERKEGKMVIRRGFEIVSGEKVLVVEDVITTGGSVKEVMDLVEESGGNIMGVGVLVDRSNGQANLHSKQFSIVEMDAVSYSAEEIPEDLAAIPIQKPGSRYSI